MRIGILGEASEPEVALVSKRLAERGVDPVVADLNGFPRERRLSILVEGGAPRVVLQGQDLSDVAAWYVRRYGFSDPLVKREMDLKEWTEIHNQLREWIQVENQKQMTLASTLEFLQELAPTVNPPGAFLGHLRKPHQTYLIRKAGLPVPDYLVTSDPDEARAFLARHPRVVYKPVAGGRHTREMTRERFDQRARALQTEPILLQALAEGRHLRAYVVGDRFVGAGEIQFDREVSIDYRETQRGALPVDLPEEIQRQCVRAAEACGMPFTGLDVIVDDERGRHAFLECNPSPMFANFERMTGIPVSDSLANLLVELAKGRA